MSTYADLPKPIRSGIVIIDPVLGTPQNDVMVSAPAVDVAARLRAQWR